MIYLIDIDIDDIDLNRELFLNYYATNEEELIILVKQLLLEECYVFEKIISVVVNFNRRDIEIKGNKFGSDKVETKTLDFIKIPRIESKSKFNES